MDIGFVQYIKNIEYSIKNDEINETVSIDKKYFIDSTITPNSIDLQLKDEKTKLNEKTKLKNATMSETMKNSEHFLTFQNYENNEKYDDNTIKNILSKSQNQAINTNYLFGSLKSFIPSINERQVTIKDEKLFFNDINVLNTVLNPELYKENNSLSFNNISSPTNSEIPTKELFINTSITDKIVFSNEDNNIIQKKSIRIKHNIELTSDNISFEILNNIKHESDGTKHSNKYMNVITFGKKKKKTYVCIYGKTLKWFSESQLFNNNKLDYNYNKCVQIYYSFIKEKYLTKSMDIYDFSKSNLIWTGDIFIVNRTLGDDTTADIYSYFYYSYDGITWRYLPPMPGSEKKFDTYEIDKHYTCEYLMVYNEVYIFLSTTNHETTYGITKYLVIFRLNYDTSTSYELEPIKDMYYILRNVIYNGKTFVGIRDDDGLYYNPHDIKNNFNLWVIDWQSFNVSFLNNIIKNTIDIDTTLNGKIMTYIFATTDSLSIIDIMDETEKLTLTKFNGNSIFDTNLQAIHNVKITTNGYIYVIGSYITTTSKDKIVLMWSINKKDWYHSQCQELRGRTIHSLDWNGNMFILGFQYQHDILSKINFVYSYDGKQWFLHEKANENTDAIFGSIVLNTLHKNTIVYKNYRNPDNNNEYKEEKELNINENDGKLILSKNSDLEFIMYKNQIPQQVNIYVNQKKYINTPTSNTESSNSDSNIVINLDNGVSTDSLTIGPTGDSSDVLHAV